MSSIDAQGHQDHDRYLPHSVADSHQVVGTEYVEHISTARITDRDFKEFARKISKWDYPFLNLSREEMQAVKRNYPNDDEEQKYQMLLIWRHKVGVNAATWRNLAYNCLRRSRYRELIRTIHQLCKCVYYFR